MFKKFICFDPIVENSGGGTQIKFSADNPPKTKDDWNKLSQEDPKTWMDLTQQNTDRMVRENRELQERLSREQQEKENLALEVNRYKTVITPQPNREAVKQPYGTDNFPKTQEEWDALSLESPTFAIDLRQAYNNRQVSNITDFQRARTDYAKEVQAEHPDMYLVEMDNGQPKKDNNGKVVLQKGPDGLPVYNKNSDKGKIWEQIYQESFRPDGTNPLDNAPNAPRLMRAELERRLVQRGQSMIQQTTQVKQNQVAVPGVLPPASVKVSFTSKEEEYHAEKAIERGVYASKEQYCQLRDSGNSGHYDESRRPDFSKK